MKIINTISKYHHHVLIHAVVWSHQCEAAAQQYHQCSIKGELGGLVAVVALWLSGYGGYSQTPWVRVPQLPFLLSSFSSSKLGSNETSIKFTIYLYYTVCIIACIIQVL